MQGRDGQDPLAAASPDQLGQNLPISNVLLSPTTSASRMGVRRFAWSRGLPGGLLVVEPGPECHVGQARSHAAVRDGCLEFIFLGGNGIDGPL